MASCMEKEISKVVLTELELCENEKSILDNHDLLVMIFHPLTIVIMVKF